MATRLRMTAPIWIVSLVLLAGVQTGALAAQVVFTIESASATITGQDLTYGPFFEQGQGSLQATATGNFLLEFDPLSGTPTSVNFLLGYGFMAFDDNGSWLPGPDPATVPASQTVPAPASYAAQTEFGDVKLAFRNTTFDWRNLNNQLPIDVDPVDGSFDISKLGAMVLPGGTVDFLHPGFGGYGTVPLGGTAELQTGGTANLIETSPGEWTLTMNGVGLSSLGGGQITMELQTQVVATAQFSTSNVDAVGTGATSGSTLGGAATTGGVDVDFTSVDTAGTLSAQEIPTTGLSFEAFEALDMVANFKTAGDTPQIWDVGFDGDFTGPMTLTFGYDENQLAGVPEADMFMWHFDDEVGEWVKIFGTVDTVNNTITVSANSLSPFALGVPEPSTLALATFGFVALAAAGWRRRRVELANAASR